MGLPVPSLTQQDATLHIVRPLIPRRLRFYDTFDFLNKAFSNRFGTQCADLGGFLRNTRRDANFLPGATLHHACLNGMSSRKNAWTVFDSLSKTNGTLKYSWRSGFNGRKRI
jgi:hypothetical protein